MANLKDFATGTVLSAPSPATSGNQLTLQSGEGALFPTPPFYATAHPDYQLPTTANAEKILVTAKTTDTLTFTRAQSPTSAKSIAIGWRISNAVFAADLFNTSLITGETPSGSVNGSNTAFTVSQAFSTGSLRVFLNGQRLTAGASADYTENSSLTGFTMNFAPATGDVLLVDYNVGSTAISYGVNSIRSDETPTGSVNGSNTAFTTQYPYVAGTLEVFINGLKQTRTTHVTESSPSTGAFTLDTAPATGDLVRVNYQYGNTAGGNADTVDGIQGSDVAGSNGFLIADYYGWQKLPSNVTLTYSSYSSTTKMGVITSNVDLTGYVTKGNRIWITQTTGGTKYGIIQEISSTTLYVFFGQSYSLANEAITAPYISRDYAPQGFIPSEDIWMVEVIDSSTRQSNTPTKNAWYVPSGSTANLAVGHGRWKPSYNVSARVHSTASSSWCVTSTTLSTTTNSETNTRLTCENSNDIPSAGVMTLGISCTPPTTVIVDHGTTASTTYTLLHRADCQGTMGSTNGFSSRAFVKFVSAYI